MPVKKRRDRQNETLLEVKDVTKKFGGLVANNSVSFDVDEHEILSVIGPNGAGKSTLFKMISSFLPTTSGEVLLRGERISNLKPHIVARKGVVRTFQETTIFKSMTARESVIVSQHLRSTASLGGYFLGSQAAHQDIKEFGDRADGFWISWDLAICATSLPPIFRRAVCGPWVSPSVWQRILRFYSWMSPLLG